MKRITIFLLCSFAVFLTLSQLPVKANDAEWNGWVEIGSGPDPNPDSIPFPPDPDVCGNPDPECVTEGNEDQPSESDPEEADEPGGECPQSEGSPIYMQNGCYNQQFLDARFPAKGPWLAISRAYNSQDLYNGIFGYGWVSHNSIQLFYTSDGTNKYVIIRLGDGRRAKFIENDDGSYTPQRVLFDFELTGNDVTGWTLNEKCPACGSAGGPRMVFDAEGFIISISDETANAISFNYDPTTKRLTSVSDDEGNQLLYSYNAKGKVSEIDMPDGNSFKYFYDVNNNLIGVVNPLNATNRYEYDTSHRLVAIVNPEGQVTVQIEYDSINRVTRYTEFGKTMTLTYSVSPEQWTTETFPDNSSRKYFYNDLAVITKIEYRNKSGSLIGTVNYSFDDDGNITSHTDVNGNTTTYVYDDDGNVIQKTDATGALHQYEYNDNHRVTKYTDPLGRETEYTYNGNGQIERIDYPLGYYETFTYNVDGLLETHRLKNGLTYEYTYDANGNLLTETEKGVTDTLSRTRSFTYDILGNRLSESDYNGNTTYYVFDIVGNMVKKIMPIGGTNVLEYNLNKQLVWTEFPNGTIISNEYDLWARLSARKYNYGYWENYSYNSMGLLEFVYSPGRTNYITYDTYGKLASADLNGYTVYYVRDGLGNLTRKYDSLGDFSRFSYDGVYRKTQERNGAGNTTYFYYDDAGNIIAEKDPNGNVTSNSYDDLDRLVKSINPLGGAKSLSYDQYSNIDVETNVFGGVIQYSYDDLNRLNRKDYSDGSYETFAYDNLQNVIEHRKRNGAVFKYTYNAINEQTSVAAPDNSVSTNLYNNFGRVVEEIDFEGHSKKYAYDISGLPSMIIEPGNSTNIYEYNFYEKPTLQIDPLGHYFYNEYDNRGRLIRIIKKANDTNPAPDSDDWVAEYGYDARGRRITKIENGITNTYTYDLAGRKLSVSFQLGHSKSFVYDANGNVTQENLPNGTTLNYTFNALNKMLQKSDNIGVLEINEYNAAGLLTKKTIQNNIIKRFEYDVLGRQTVAYDGYSNIAKYVYYSGGQPKYFINRKNQTNTFYYDFFDRLTAKYDGNGTLFESNVYNSIGNLLQKIDAKGKAITYEYDDAGRVKKLTWPDGSFQEHKYDLGGNRTWRQDEDGNITTFEYNDFNQLIKVDYPGNDDKFITYDINGNRTSISNSASVTYFTFDTSRRIQSANQDGYLVAYEGAPTNNWVKINYPGGKVLTRTLDARRRVVNIADQSNMFLNLIFDNQIIQTASNGNAWTVSPAFGANFELTNLVYQKDNVYGIRYSYIRDKIDQKDKAINRVFPSNSFAYSYDDAQRLIAFQKGVVEGGNMSVTNFDRIFVLDDLANITNLTTDASPQTRAYNDLNQVTNIEGQAFAYDKRGNLTNDGARSYIYDYENQLVSIKENGTAILSNVYDAAGRLIKLITTNESRYFVYDGQNIIEEYLESAPATPDKTYILSGGLDSLVACQHDSHTYYYQVDDNQNILVVTDENGDIAERYRYTAYGEPTFLDSNNVERTESAINNSRLYTGRRWIPEAGLYYYRARYYSPTLKRFISRDPAQTVDTLNLYLYVYSNPVNFIDPLGLLGVEGPGGYPKVEKDGDCVKTTNGITFDGKKIPIMKRIFPQPAEIAIEFFQEVCNSCCPKDSKHPGAKMPKINYGLMVKAEISTGWVPVPNLSISIPSTDITIGLSVSLTIFSSVSLEFGYDNCYDSYTGGGKGEIGITAGACLGVGSCEESDEEEAAIISFSLTLTAEMTGKLKIALINPGNGFVFSIDLCFEAVLAANAEVELFWGWAKAGHSITLLELEETCLRVVEKRW